MTTKDDLQAAFAGESQANRRYTAFAKKADADGYPVVARLFRAVAVAETVHALTHLEVAGGIEDTQANLKTAIEGEDYEFTSMYPEFLSRAQDEGNRGAIRSFERALEVEGTHRDLYKAALEAVEGGSDLPDEVIHVCDICGHTVWGEAPDQCPVCKALKTHFFEVK